VELTADTPVSGSSALGAGISRVWADAIAVVVLYSLLFAACGGYVIYTSVRPVSIPQGLFSYPWILAFLVLAVVGLALLVLLLVLGLVHLHQGARLGWGWAIAWVSVVAADAAIGWLIIHDYGHWVSLNAHEIGWSPPGCEQDYPACVAQSAGPYLRPLIETGGLLAAGAAMIAFITATTRKPAPTALDGHERIKEADLPQAFELADDTPPLRESDNGDG
jgi:hypothetical protein